MSQGQVDLCQFLPPFLLLDEPSMGLAPLPASEIFEIIQRINKEEGVSTLLVEQNVRLALSIAVHGYVMENGRIVREDTVEKLRENAGVREFYPGLTEVGEKRAIETSNITREGSGG
jgi:branched-chain amino acid transport system ATP-binding protein